jgi:hypothetical protein
VHFDRTCCCLTPSVVFQSSVAPTPRDRYGQAAKVGFRHLEGGSMPPQTPPDVLQQLGARQRWISETTSQDSSEVQQCPLLLSAASGVASTAGQMGGLVPTRSTTAAQRDAEPLNMIDDIVDEWGRQSFPASDPPSNW